MNLKQDLLALPINTQEKIFLWLLSQKLKSGTDLLVRKKSVQPEIYQLNIAKINKFLKKYNYSFFSKAHWQHFHPLNKLRSEQIGKFYYVAINSQILQIMKKRIPRHRSNHTLVGKFYGFPPKTSQVMEKNVTSPKLLHAQEEYSRFRKKYWYPYLTYAIRKNHEAEDIKLAKSWADETKNNFPE